METQTSSVCSPSFPKGGQGGFFGSKIFIILEQMLCAFFYSARAAIYFLNSSPYVRKIPLCKGGNVLFGQNIEIAIQ